MINATLDAEDRVHVNASDEDDPKLVAGLLSAMTPAWHAEDHGGASAPYSWPLYVQLTETFADLQPDKALFLRAKRDRRRRSHVREPYAMVEFQGLRHTPYPYQIDAVRMIREFRRALLVDDPGTGKTGSALLGLRSLEEWEPGTTLPVIVVCPASVVDQWLDECATWAPDTWRAVAWRGPKRHDLAGSAEVYVMSYSTFTRDSRAGKLAEIAAQALVLDEAHALVNRNTQQSKEARKLAKRLETVILLTGTPVVNAADDLWALCNALDAVAFPAYHRWRDRVCRVDVRPYATVVLGLDPARKPELFECLQGQYRAVKKEEALPNLPPKVRSRRTVDLPPAWLKAYREYEKEMTTTTPDGQFLAAMEPLEVVTRLVQLSNGAADVERVMAEDKHGVPRVSYKLVSKAPYWKLPVLHEVLAERPTQQVLVFAPFRDLILAAWEEHQRKHPGTNSSLVVGGQDPETRTKHVQRFQAGDHRVLFATAQAGGVGLTLTAASTVVFLQRPWSWEKSSQAEDRAHRIGSEIHESIEIIDLIAKGTMDEKILKALRHKGFQADGFSPTVKGIRDLLTNW